MRPATIFASPRWQRSSPALLAGPRSRSLAGSRSPSCQEWVNLGATVVSPFTMRLSAALLPAGLLLAACATFNANVQTKKDLNQLKHIFVQQSGNTALGKRQNPRHHPSGPLYVTGAKWAQQNAGLIGP